MTFQFLSFAFGLFFWLNHPFFHYSEMARLSSLDQPLLRGIQPQFDTISSDPPVDVGAAALQLKPVSLVAEFGDRTPPPPPAPLIVHELPPWIEQFSSFITSSEPRAAIAAIATAFGQRVDYEISTTKAKVCLCFVMTDPTH